MISAFIVLSTLLLTVYTTVKFVISPWIRVNRYKAKDIHCGFFPLIGLLHFVNKSFRETGDFFGYYKNLPKEDQNVRAHVVNIGDRVVIQLLDSKLIKEFYSNQHNYVKIPFSNAFQVLVGTGLIRAEGKLWKQHRKTLSNLFHYEFLKQNIPLMVKTTRELLDQLKEAPLDDVKVMDELQKITGEIVGRIFFGENLNKYTMEGEPLTLYLADLLVAIFKHQRKPIMIFSRFVGGSPYFSSTFRKLMQKVLKFRKVCFDIIKDRRASNIKAHDMLGLLLDTQTSLSKEEAYSDEDIINEFITFFAAGMDTTGHLIAMTLYLLDNHRQYLDRIKKEIQDAYHKEEDISQESLNQMDFTHAVLKETMRFYTPAPGTFSRTAMADHKLLDLEIKKGMSVRPNPLYNYFNPKYFEHPEKFLPERWLDKSSVLDSFVYIPFSAGPRNCIGQHLSIMESKIILAEFLDRFEFEVPKDYKLRMTMGFLYEPTDKLVMKLTPKTTKA